MLGGAKTMTAAELLLVESAIEVAVTVMSSVDETEAGALYVAEVVVVLLKVPQAEPVTPAPETLQVTPLLLVSFITVALKFTV
jgi:hypothetical protein